MRLTISNQENNKMQVSIDGLVYDELDGSQLADNIHAVQWYDTHGEIEYKDPVTNRMTNNVEITSIDIFQFAIDMFYAAKTAEEEELALEEAQLTAYMSAYEQAIANGLSEEEAMLEGQTASEQVT